MELARNANASSKHMHSRTHCPKSTIPTPLLHGLDVGILFGLTDGGGSSDVPLYLHGFDMPMATTAGLGLAAVGLAAGFGAGLRTRLSPERLRQVFAAGRWIVGGYLIWPNVPALSQSKP